MGEKKYKFQKLTPVDGADLGLYEDALDFVFENPDIRNVAISGAYGAGKSSILESYKKKKKETDERKYIHISLTHFEHPNQNNANEAEINTVELNILEGKILNQLLHQIPAANIPQTIFKVKGKINTKNIMFSAVFMTAFLFLSFSIFFFDSWYSIIPLRSEFIFIFCMFAWASSLYVILVELIKMQKNRNIFKKFSLQGNEIEIFEEANESFFDKYLNEILYLFENVEADVIVFEDIDRFEVTRIFERLHEVNRLVNIQLKKESKSLRFFYLLRDDIFVHKDRTKFFDYIIPIVPVVDSSNSYDQFISHFKEESDQFDEWFLQGLFLYVDEMRILKNICNEFVIYYNKLNTTELDCNKMLAMVTYKNLFPRDFNDLQLNRGFVHALFISKGNLTEEKHLKEKADELQKWIEEGYISGNTDAEAEEDLWELKDQIHAIQSKMLKDVLTRDNIDQFFKTITFINEVDERIDFSDIKSSDYFPLLKYLIRYGYIDETYPDYMTYFYGSSLSHSDKTFLRSITDKKAKEYTHQLKNLSLIVSRLRSTDFDQEEIFNFDLFQYLLQEPQQSEPQRLGFRNKFLRQLKKAKNVTFVGAFFDKGEEQIACVKYLNVFWPDLFSYALTKSALNPQQLHLYSIFTLYYSSDSVIEEVNVENCLTQYISDNAGYLEISEPDVGKLIKKFELLDVSFKCIEPKQANKELLLAVYNKSLYEINFNNISLMLRKFYSVDDDYGIQHRNYSIIMSKPEESLATYIQANMSQYIDIILSSSNGIIKDEEEHALLLLNNNDLSFKQKEKYINQLETNIQLLTNVEDKTLWKILLEKCLAEYSINNIIEYFVNSGSLDSSLVEFIDSNTSQLDYSIVKDIYSKDEASKLFNAVVICNSLSNNKYKEIIISFKFIYPATFNIPGISDDKLMILIEHNIIPMAVASLLFIRESYPAQIMYFIEHNIEKYVSEIRPQIFDVDEALEILEWGISDDIKINLLRHTNEPLSIIGSNYSDSVSKYILENNLDQNELPELFESYDNWANEIQTVILELAVQYIDAIFADPTETSLTLLKFIFKNTQIEKDKKTNLLATTISRFDLGTCIEILDALNLSEYGKLFNPESRPRFKINEINRKLLTAFKDREWIKTFKEDAENNVYRITRNKDVNISN